MPSIPTSASEPTGRLSFAEKRRNPKLNFGPLAREHPRSQMSTTETTAAFGQDAVRALRALVARYGAGEAEIARTYFEGTRTPAHDRVWLTSQVGRELSRVYQLQAAAA